MHPTTPAPLFWSRGLTMAGVASIGLCLLTGSGCGAATTRPTGRRPETSTREIDDPTLRSPTRPTPPTSLSSLATIVTATPWLAPGTVASTLSGPVNRAAIRQTRAASGQPSSPAVVIRTSQTTVTRRIALLGDSVLADMARDIRTTGFGGHPDTGPWIIDGQTGSGWGASEDASGQWPLGIVQGTWAVDQVRALGENHPAAAVIELGTNDALRAAFAAATSDAETLAARRAGTDHNISAVVAQAAAQTSCVVLVTPEAYPTPLFGGGTLYSREAIQVADRLDQQASITAQRATLIADWSTESEAHHLGAATPGNWFAASDEIHPNFAGEQALAALIASTVAKCPGFG